MSAEPRIHLSGADRKGRKSQRTGIQKAVGAGKGNIKVTSITSRALKQVRRSKKPWLLVGRKTTSFQAQKRQEMRKFGSRRSSRRQRRRNLKKSFVKHEIRWRN